MKRCTRCVLPETTPNITFDREGICNFCRDHQPLAPRDDRGLWELFEKYPGEGDYDCVLGLSGGRDSSYALYLLTQVYKKRVLAVHYRSPLSHEQGTINAQRMADAFNTKLVIITDKDDLHRKTFANNVQAYFKKPSPAMVSMMCVACKIKWVDIYRIAKENQVKLIVAASNPYEGTDFKLGFQGIKPGDKHIYRKRLVTGVKEVARNPRYINGDTLRTTLMAFAYLDSKSPVLKYLYPHQKKIDIFYYTDWDEKTVIDTISRYGWSKPGQASTTWRFDCVVGRVKDYIYYSNYGFTEKDDLYSKLIRDNKMSRGEAMSRLEAENANVMDIQAVDQCLGVCGLCIADLTK
jgi:hypothetical protein